MFSSGALINASRPTLRRVNPLLKFNSIRASSLSSTTQTRSASTTPENVTQDQEHSILAAQRRLRPVAPHLSIYQPQLTWYASAANRITGVAVSGGVYAFALAYLASPVFGLHLDSATIAAAFGSLPIAAKVVIKAAVALPFTYHSWSGIRHLIWDTGKALDIKGVYRTGYVVFGLTALSTVYLAFV